MASVHQLKCFLSAYRAGSLTAAATELGYTQPAISEQIRLLEKSLGIELFNRVGRGVIPTDAAAAFLPHAEAAINSIAEGERAVKSNKSLESGTIRFGMLGDAHFWGGADLISTVLDMYPGMRVEFSGHHSVQIFEEVKQGRIDAAIISAPIAIEGLAVQTIARDELVFITSDKDLASSPVTPSKLAAADLIMPDISYRRTDTNWAAVFDLFTEAQTPLNSRVEVEDIEMAVDLVGRGYGSTVSSKHVAELLIPRIAPNAYWARFKPRKYQTFSIVTRRNGSLSPAAQLMVQLAAQKFGDLVD